MINKLNEVVIVAAARTPIGTYNGSLKDIKADQLGSAHFSKRKIMVVP